MLHKGLGIFGKVLIKRPAVRHIDDLQTAANPDNRNFPCFRPLQKQHVEMISFRPHRANLPTRFFPIKEGIHIVSARQKEPIDAVHKGFHDIILFIEGNDEGDTARLRNRTDIIMVHIASMITGELPAAINHMAAGNPN